jgi:hypothetical protein
MVLAAPAFAYVQPGSLGSTTKVKDGPRTPKEQSDETGFGGPVYTDIPATIEPVGTDAVKPVPEPATMAMASMGLLAVGAALRKRRPR